MYSGGGAAASSRPSHFKQHSELTFDRNDYFNNDKQSRQRSGSPLSPLEGYRQDTKRSQFGTDVRKTTTTTLNVPVEVTSPTQILLSDAPLASSQLVYGAPHVVRTTSPAPLSRVVMSPRASYVQNNSRMVLSPAPTVVPMATSILPSTATLTSVQPVMVQQQQYSPTVTRIETIKEQITHEEKTQIQRLQAMNDFLTQNYTLVYEKLKELENRPQSPSQQPIIVEAPRPSTEQVSCINDQWLMKSLVSKIEHVCDLELQTALARFRTVSLNVRQYRTASVLSSTTTARFS